MREPHIFKLLLTVTLNLRLILRMLDGKTCQDISTSRFYCMADQDAHRTKRKYNKAGAYTAICPVGGLNFRSRGNSFENNVFTSFF